MSALAIRRPEPPAIPIHPARIKDATVNKAILAVYLCDVWQMTERQAAAVLACSIPSVQRFKVIGRERFEERFGRDWLTVLRRIDRAVRPIDIDDLDSDDPHRGTASDVGA